MDDGRWTMDDGRWTMDDGRWTMDDTALPLAERIARCPLYVVHKHRLDAVRAIG
jgi:hypothetical protein